MKFLRKLLFYPLLLIMGITLIRGYFSSNSELELHPWHEPSKYKEPHYQSYATIEEYLQAEKVFLDKTYKEVSIEENVPYNRYAFGSISDPYSNNENLNVSYQMVPDNIKGGVLLLHGLTDSPYITRDLARIFYEQGYYVLGMRYKYHGTHPGEMAKLNWKDFLDTAKFGAKMVQEKIKGIPEAKFFIAGYSTGAAVSLYYTSSEVKKDPALPVPDKLFWFSPAMGVDPLAKAAFLDVWLSKIPYFKKFAWLDIYPEYDSGKYNSFHKNAATQVDNMITKAKKASKNAPLPPIYAYTSLEDATVDESKLFQVLGEIGNERGELVIFDANRKFNQFFKKKIKDLEFAEVLKKSKLKSNILILTNYENQLSDQVTIFQSKGGKSSILETESPLIWDHFTFSLAHLSIPISPENPLYGRGTILGEINAKGEKNITPMDTESLIRLRYNQFFSFLKENMVRNMED